MGMRKCLSTENSARHKITPLRCSRGLIYYGPYVGGDMRSEGSENPRHKQIYFIWIYLVDWNNSIIFVY